MLRIRPLSAALLRRPIRSNPIRSLSTIPTSTLFETTTLPNKVRVATDASPGHFYALGIYVDAGSRYEKGNTGVGHLVDRMAFKSTQTRTAEEMSTAIERVGGNVMCHSSRETLMYQASMFKQDLPSVVELISDTMLRPLILPDELEMQKDATSYELREIWAKPELILPEILHHVAYADNTLGNPLLCPEERLDQISPETIREYLRMWYRPERIVVAGVGMPHEQLVELATRHFGHLEPSNSISTAKAPQLSSSSTSPASAVLETASSLLSPSSTPAHTFGSPASLAETDGQLSFESLSTAKARYTGGELYLPRDDLEFTHIYLAFEGLGIHDPDIYALATLQVLLGGGSSFSAGGPGKGMYSRLYTHVLNLHHAVDSCQSFHHCYRDSGLFGISLSCTPAFVPRAADLLGSQLDALTRPVRNGVSPRELERAKNQLKSQLVMALESRLVEAEDLGRQVQVHGRKVTVEEMCELVDKVGMKDLHRVASRVLRPVKGGPNGNGSSEVTIVAQGRVEKLGDVRRTLAEKYGLGRKGD
uniref:Mitochondrial-processing peptidase subunit alpha n=1 Tax=Bartheletia paradoxa TaxID=669517 RepID=A0A2D0XI20_9BASI|nr:hypothetical protein SPAR06735 [Bartheletia paradoxa]